MRKKEKNIMDIGMKWSNACNLAISLDGRAHTQTHTYTHTKESFINLKAFLCY